MLNRDSLPLLGQFLDDVKVKNRDSLPLLGQFLDDVKVKNRDSLPLLGQFLDHVKVKTIMPYRAGNLIFNCWLLQLLMS